MTSKQYLVTALASLVALASVGPALADGNYYEGIDVNSPRKTTSAVRKTDERVVTGSINSNAPTYGFPNGAERLAAPVIAKGGEGEYYQGISRR